MPEIMCANSSNPISNNNQSTHSSSESSQADQDPKLTHLKQLIEKQSERNKKRQKIAIEQLPVIQQDVINPFITDIGSLKEQFLRIEDLDASSKDYDALADDINEDLEKIKNKHANFDAFYLENLLVSKPNLAASIFYLDVSKNIFINNAVYMNELRHFVETNIDMMISEFCPKFPSDISRDDLEFNIALKDKKVDPKVPRLGLCPETHNYGRLPAFIKCSINGKTLFKLVYKPRNALIDKAVIETFKKINMLNDEQKSSKTIPLPEYKIVSLDNCSLWEYIDGKDIKKEKSAGVYIHNKFSNRPIKLENAQKVLNRLDAVLTRMQISDLLEPLSHECERFLLLRCPNGLLHKLF